jgi:transcriptional regulator with PAS, ATPase and Fis domain
MRDKQLNIDTVISPAYRQIWDNSLLGVMVLDKEGVVRYINRLLIRTDDPQEADILGKKMVDFYPMEKERHVSMGTIKSGKPIIKKTILYYPEFVSFDDVHQKCLKAEKYGNDLEGPDQVAAEMLA